MSSESSVRLWRATKAAGRPWPRLSDDDVLDFMVMEAVAIRVRKIDDEAQRKAERAAKRKEWQADTSELEKFRG